MSEKLLATEPINNNRIYKGYIQSTSRLLSVPATKDDWDQVKKIERDAYEAIMGDGYSFKKSVIDIRRDIFRVGQDILSTLTPLNGEQDIHEPSDYNVEVRTLIDLNGWPIDEVITSHLDEITVIGRHTELADILLKNTVDQLNINYNSHCITSRVHLIIYNFGDGKLIIIDIGSFNGYAIVGNDINLVHEGSRDNLNIISDVKIPQKLEYSRRLYKLSRAPAYVKLDVGDNILLQLAHVTVKITRKN